MLQAPILSLITLATMLVSLIMFSTRSLAQVVFGLEPEVAYRTVYQKEKSPKALAIGPGGLWHIETGAATKAKAQRQALRECNSHVRQLDWSQFGNCELVASDADFLWAKPSVGPSLDEILPGPDTPLLKARTFDPEQGAPRGIVLMIHGSGSRYSESQLDNAFMISWIRYFTATGLLVVHPLSFDDKFPVTEYSGWNTPQRYPKSSLITKIRLAQTKRTLSNLRQRYPGLPVFIWAHSAGGSIAESLGQELAGIIIIGDKCGIGSPELQLFTSDTPVLYIFGDSDEYIFKGESRITKRRMRRYCGPYYFTGNKKIVVAPDSDHGTTIFRQNVLDAVSEMLGNERFDLSQSNSTQAPGSRAVQAYSKQYRTSPLKKALVVGGDSYAFVSSAPTQIDANALALTECNKQVTGKSFPDSGRHACQLFAEGDKIVGVAP